MSYYFGMQSVADYSCVLSSTPSDSHTWNLIYMQLLLEEHGFAVHNLGACVSEGQLIQTVMEDQPDIVVISSINGLGLIEGQNLITAAIEKLGNDIMPLFLIGGKLTTCDSELSNVRTTLTTSGFDGVFVGAGSVVEFKAFLNNFMDNRRLLASRSKTGS